MLQYALLTATTTGERLEAYWRDDMRWIWLLLGLILLITLLTFFYIHHHHRYTMDTYKDNCNVNTAPTTIYHDHTYTAAPYDPNVVRTNVCDLPTLNDRLARGEITQAEYDRLKVANKL